MAIRPIIFVGLGSTGGKIVSRLKTQMDAKADDLRKRFCRYVNIRSEVNPEAGTNDSISTIVLADDGESLYAKQTIDTMWAGATDDEEGAKSFQQWWPRDSDSNRFIPDIINTLNEGVNGSPAIGRALLHYKLSGRNAEGLGRKFTNLQEAFEKEFEALPAEGDARRQVIKTQICCFVFGSLAGGTCNGTLFDIALIIKSQLNADTRLFGVFLMGDVCYGDGTRESGEIEKEQRNTNFAVAEMAFLSTPSGWKIASDAWPLRLGRIDLKMKKIDGMMENNPFRSITLLGAENDDGYSLYKAKKDFEAYWDFLATYYSDLANSEDLIEIYYTRDIDVDVNQKFKERPRNFSRIGYMSVQLPLEKIKALLELEIAYKFKNHFSQFDAQKCSDKQNIFFRNLNISGTVNDIITHKIKLPEFLSASEMELQSTLEEFRETWATAKEEIDKVYQDYLIVNGKISDKFQAEVDAFTVRFQKELHDLLNSFLGGNNGGSIEFGNVKQCISDILAGAENKYEEASRQLEKASEDVQTEQMAYEEALRAYSAAFPEKKLINYFRRKNFDGNARMEDRLDRYKIAKQTRVNTTIQVAFILPLLTELKKHECIRTLISHFGTWNAYNWKVRQNKVDALFSSQDDNVNVIEREILAENEQQVREYYVEPLLGENNVQLDHMLKNTLRNWAMTRDERQGVADVWWKLFNEFALRTPGEANSEYYSNATIRNILDTFSQGLKQGYQDAYAEVFGKGVSELSIWDAIRKLVENELKNAPLDRYGKRREAEDILKNFFKTHFSHAKCFTRLLSLIPQDSFLNIPTKPYYICNEADAEKCFEQLGISNSGTFLRELIYDGLSIQSMQMDSTEKKIGTTTSARDRIRVLLVEFNQLPYAYREFGSKVMALLSDKGVQEAESPLSWFDTRFPRWIQQWWDSDSKPYYLESWKKWQEKNSKS